MIHSPNLSLFYVYGRKLNIILLSVPALSSGLSEDKPGNGEVQRFDNFLKVVKSEFANTSTSPQNFLQPYYFHFESGHNKYPDAVVEVLPGWIVFPLWQLLKPAFP